MVLSYEEWINLGDQYYREGTLELLQPAEYAYAEALKIAVQAKETSKQASIIEKIGDTYLEYSKRDGKGDNFTKALALYNAALARHKMISKQKTIEQRAMVSLLVEKCKQLEKLFLEKALGKSIGEELVSTPQSDIKHQLVLAKIRQTVEAELTALDKKFNPSLEHNSDKREHLYHERAQEIHKLYGFIAQEVKQFISVLVAECRNVLGKPPCNYAILGLGSLAREEMTPYSDFEWAILIENEGEKDYFLKLTYLLYIKVINLGETILPSMAIASLNDYHSQKPADNWFYDDLTTRGFSFDGLMPHACKYPIGRSNLYDKEGRLIQKGFELIGTPEQLVNLQTEKGFEENLHLASTLTNTLYIEGDEKLASRYKRLLDSYLHLAQSHQIPGQERSIALLKKDVERYRPLQDNFIQQGKLYIVKKEIFRLPTALIESLGLYYGFTGQSNWETLQKLKENSIITETALKNLQIAWGIAAEIRLRTYLANKGQKEQATAIGAVRSAEIELKDSKQIAQLLNIDSDKGPMFRFYYTILPFYDAIEKFVIDQNEQTLKNVFNTQSFFDMNPLIKTRIYLRLAHYEAAEKALDPYVRSLLRQQKKSLAVSFLDNFDLSRMLTMLCNIYIALGELTKAEEYITIKLKQRSLLPQYLKTHHGFLEQLDNIERHNHAVSCYSLGLVFLEQAKYEKAQFWFNKSINIYKKLYGENSLPFAQTLVSLGSIYLSEDASIPSAKAREVAKKYFISALAIYENLPLSQEVLISKAVCSVHFACIDWFESRSFEAEKALQEGYKIVKQHFGPTHPTVFSIENNMILFLSKKEGVSECQKKFKELILKFEKFYQTRNHPTLATVLHNFGNLLIEKGDYEEAEKLLLEAEKIYSAFYESRHPMRVATIRDLIRCIVRQGNKIILGSYSASYTLLENYNLFMVEDAAIEHYLRANEYYAMIRPLSQKEEIIIRSSLFLMCGENAYANGKLTEALEYYQVASLLYPENKEFEDKFEAIQREINMQPATSIIASRGKLAEISPQTIKQNPGITWHR